MPGTPIATERRRAAAEASTPAATPGVVVVGQLSDWTVPVGAPAYLVAPVMERVTVPAETRGAEFQHFSGAHHTDVIGRAAAMTWLAEQFALWMMRCH